MWRDPLGLMNPRHKRPGVLNPPRGIPAPVVPVAPTITASPSISGSNIIGSTLVLDVGAASGVPAPTASIQWLRAGVVIPGETGTSYVTRNADGSLPITARVTWTNSAGSTAPATTNTILMGAAQPSQNVDVEFPGLISDYTAPAIAATFAVPSGWSSADPHWDAVAFLGDFERFFGADQSEIGTPYEFTSAGSAKLPAVTTDGMVFDGSQRYVTDGSMVLGSGAGDVTIEAVGLLPGAAGTLISCYSRATPANVNWSIGWQADPAAWVITVWNGGTPLNFTVPDTAPTAPVALCLEKAAGTLRVYRNGAVLDTRAAGAFIAGNLTTNRVILTVGGGSASNTAMTIRHLRVTNGVARYGAAYTPAAIPLTAPKSTGGAHRIGFGDWTQTTKDIMIPMNGKVLVGTSTRIGMGTVYDPVAKRSHVRAVALWDERDDHNNPSFLRRTDDRIVTFATGHTYDKFYRGISAAPDDWLSTPSFDDITAQMAPATRFSYSKSFQLEGLPGEPVYLTTRIGNNTSTYREMVMKSLDGGQTFTRWNYLDTPDARRMYPIFEKTSPTRADALTTAGNIGDPGGNEGIYHFAFDAEVVRDSQGNEIALPMTVNESATSLYGKWVEGLESNLLAIRRFGDLLRIAYTIRPASGRRLLMLASYNLANPGAWQQEYVTDLTGHFAFHPTSPDNIFKETIIPGAGLQVAEWVRLSKGNWRVAKVLTSLPTDRGVTHLGLLSCADPDVLLMSSGRSTTYNDYMVTIAALPLAGVASAPSVEQPSTLPASVKPVQGISINLGRPGGYPTPAPHVSWTLDGQEISTGVSVTLPADAQGKTLTVEVEWLNASGSVTETITRTVAPLGSLLFLDAPPALRTQFTINSATPDSVRVTTAANATRSIISWAAVIPVGAVISFDYTISGGKQLYVRLTAALDASPPHEVVLNGGTGSGSVSYTVTQANRNYLDIVVGSGRNDVVNITNFKVTAP